MQKRREELIYQGYQFKDFITDLLNEANLIKADVSKLTKNSPKTVSEWFTGLSIPNQANFQNLLNTVVPNITHEQRVAYTNTYNAIRAEYLKAKKRLNAQKKQTMGYQNFK
jgi:hypothetical protein